MPHLRIEIESLVQDKSVCPLSSESSWLKLYGTQLTSLQAEAQHVIFTDDKNKRYEDYVDGDFQEMDQVLGIKYEQIEIYKDTLLLLRYNCPDTTCDVACYGWPHLHGHVKKLHHKVMCDLCTRNKKVFTHEHELFTTQELRKHEKFGDDNPGAVDQSGFKGHPECGFCRQRFYGDDELYAHCRDKHEKCHICDRRIQGREQRYYVDYNSLEGHFRQDHFLCADRECLDKKFVVFESEMDLKAHQLEAHPNDLSKDARRDARIVDISSFDYRTPYQNTLGRRDRDGRGRGRNPNTEVIPPSSAQPLRRDELAYQRQMAIHSAQSISTRTFGGQLTLNSTRPNDRSQDQATVTALPTRPVSVPIENLNLNVDLAANAPIPAENLTPQEQARRLQHTSVMDRASTLLRHDTSKISIFRSSVSSYRTSQLTASASIDTFFTLFDVPSTELGKLIKELAEIYENESKRLDLLKAWNDWRAINEDYPSLPGPSGILPTATAGSGGHRVLKLKSSTAQSSRSAVSKQSSWGNAAAANPFPAMPTASANRSGAGRVGATPWIAPSAPISSRPTSRAADRPQASSSSAHGAKDTAFPALPAAKKPNTLIAGLTKGTVRWDEGRPNRNSNPWAITGTSRDTSDERAEAEADEEVIGGKKKKGKKQVVYKFG